jgi:DNA-binding CsgD family transcriptional regulator
LLRGRYNLSPAEARLAAALASGQSMNEYAEARSVSLNTARTQLKSTMMKVGVRRQVDLVREVLLGVISPKRQEG